MHIVISWHLRPAALRKLAQNDELDARLVRVALPSRSVLACYALLTYRWRARHILAKDQPEWGDPQGPLLVTFVVVFMLLSAWVAEMKVYLTP